MKTCLCVVAVVGFALFATRGAQADGVDEDVRIGDDTYRCGTPASRGRGGEVTRTDGAGVIRDRWILPGACVGMRADARGLVVEVRADHWRGEWRPSDPRARTAAWMTSIFGWIAAERAACESDSVLPTEPGPRAIVLRDHRERLEAELVRLAEGAERDPTNPWWRVVRAQFLHALGRNAEMRDELTRAIAGDAEGAHYLVRASSRIRRMDEALGDAAFNRGVAALLRLGYEPELATSALTRTVFLETRARPTLELPRDYEEASREAERIATLAPMSEASVSLYRTLERLARERRSGAAAARWRELAEAARDSNSYGIVSRSAEHAGHLLNVLLAGSAALMLLALVFTIRGRGVPRERPASGWTARLPFARISIAQRVGYAAACVVIVLASHEAAIGIGEIALVAGGPAEMQSGSLGHPGTLAFLSTGFDRTRSARFIRAVALQQGGELEAAERLYTALDDPRSRVNLGVISAARGDDSAARALWTRALSEDASLAEAEFNLDRRGAGPRVERARAFGVEGPIIVVPSRADWETAIHDRAAQTVSGHGFVGQLVGGIEVIRTLDDAPAIRFGPTELMLAIVAFAALLGLVPPYRGPDPRTESTKLDRGLAWLVPGAASRYGFVGPFVLLTFAVALVGSLTLLRGAGVADPLSAIAAIPAERYFGISGLDESPHHIIHRAYPVALAAAGVLHVAFMAVVTRERRMTRR